MHILASWDFWHISHTIAPPCAGKLFTHTQTHSFKALKSIYCTDQCSLESKKQNKNKPIVGITPKIKLKCEIN